MGQMAVPSWGVGGVGGSAGARAAPGPYDQLSGFRSASVALAAGRGPLLRIPRI